VATKRQSSDSVRRALGLQVQEVRRERGLTQEGLADKLAMLPSNYARIEQGRQNVTVDTLVKIANGLGVDVADLFTPPKARKSRPGRPRKTE